ncbi:hypothetical protein GGD54_004412 [Rhizobium tropici]|uniref:Uncharacterized protein n=1 Tax=Rhizobium tropici TaxID=398 RepID=A0ABR6R3Z0_RHITR|nr:hypothetical protein [Rhizobium tropici]MBB5595896.1 hypothetical protein [Rhizobium tropici]MBB6493889.1 hypothetical protein [Rhizobium tropici]
MSSNSLANIDSLSKYSEERAIFVSTQQEPDAQFTATSSIATDIPIDTTIIADNTSEIAFKLLLRGEGGQSTSWKLRLSSRENQSVAVGGSQRAYGRLWSCSSKHGWVTSIPWEAAARAETNRLARSLVLSQSAGDAPSTSCVWHALHFPYFVKPSAIAIVRGEKRSSCVEQQRCAIL